ncbi:MAG: cytochrome c maturation protein CcmE [Saprospiraceae bacterium]|nr:cytochrome c maturation protein CcmE [Saprospiraceae bacterium]
MKPTFIAALLLIAGAIGLFIWSGSKMDTYSNFSQAADNNGRSVQVICDLSKDKEMVYDPLNDANYFTFFAKDKDGLERKIVYYGAKPQDFELSEGIVLTGKMAGDEFIASNILMKCPSKYKDEEIFVRGEQTPSSTS